MGSLGWVEMLIFSSFIHHTEKNCNVFHSPGHGVVHAVVSENVLKNLTLRHLINDVILVRVFSKKLGVATPDCSCITLVGAPAKVRPPN